MFNKEFWANIRRGLIEAYAVIMFWGAPFFCAFYLLAEYYWFAFFWFAGWVLAFLIAMSEWEG